NGAHFSCRPLYIADDILRCTLHDRRRNILDLLSQWVSHRSESLPAVYYEPKPGVLDGGTYHDADKVINGIAEQVRLIIQMEEQKLAIETDFCKHNYHCRCRAKLADMKKRAEEVDGLMARLLQQAEGCFEQAPYLFGGRDASDGSQYPKEEEEARDADELMDVSVEY